MLNVKVNDLENVKVDFDTTLIELLQNVKEINKNMIIAKVDNNIDVLSRQLKTDCKVEFLDMYSEEGYRAYQNTLSFLFLYATKKVLGNDSKMVVEYSISKNYYCTIENVEITDELIEKLDAVIKEVIQRKAIIEKVHIPTIEAIKYLEKYNMDDKVKLLKYHVGSFVHVYKLDDFYTLSKSVFAVECEKLQLYKLEKYKNGIFIKFPDRFKKGEIIVPKNFEKVMDVFEEFNEWGKILQVNTVSKLNQKILDGKLKELILINEALHEKKLINIVDQICKQNKKLVLIAGPSSSGKTTFSHRLSIQLKVNHLNPVVISLDDFYKERENIAKDEHGNYDFESIEAFDVSMLNHAIKQLLDGKEVEIPHYNFVTGHKEYKGRFVQLEEKDVLVIEGIHGLNDLVATSVKKEDKFKIFISALSHINIDDHNRVSTRDTRLIRRIVRDNQFRGTKAEVNLGMWKDVMKGENKHIFPYQNEADAVFNSALSYELNILKPYILPLLFNIKHDSPVYSNARRLIKFLDNFLAISCDDVPKNSIIREFIGNGSFR